MSQGRSHDRITWADLKVVMVIVARAQNRAAGESIAGYVAALRELAEHCKYGTTLPEMLRDRLVCGVNHEGSS